MNTRTTRYYLLVLADVLCYIIRDEFQKGIIDNKNAVDLFWNLYDKLSEEKLNDLTWSIVNHKLFIMKPYYSKKDLLLETQWLAFMMKCYLDNAEAEFKYEREIDCYMKFENFRISY